MNFSDPVVSYCETITKESDCGNPKGCLAKSANKHNRLWCKAQPIDDQLGLDIIDGKIGPKSKMNK